MAPDVHAAQKEAIRLRVGADFRDLARYHSRVLVAGLDRFHFETGHGEGLGDSLDGWVSGAGVARRKLHELVQPVERQFHAFRGLVKLCQETRIILWGKTANPAATL